MPSRTEEHLDKLIRETIRGYMQEAGEPRPELLWTGIQKEIAAGKKNRFRYSPFTRLALFKWQLAGAAVLASCLLAVTVFFPDQMTAFGKRIFQPAPIVQKAGDSHVSIATGGPARNEVKKHAMPDGKEGAEAEEIIAPPGKSPDPGSGRTGFAPAPASRDEADTKQSDPVPDPAPADAAARILMAPAPEQETGPTLRDVRRTAPFPVRYPAYLPPGFTEGDIGYQTLSEQSGEVRVTFVQHDGPAAVRFTQQNTGHDFGAGRGYGPEFADRRELQIKGHEAALSVTRSEGETHSELTWLEDNMVYRISGNVKPEEIIKMAESLQP